METHSLHGVHLTPNVRGLAPSATIAIADRARSLRAEGRDVIGLGLGQSPFPVPECVVEALRLHAHEKDYLPVQGLPALREAVAEHHCRTFGICPSPEQVLVGPGSKELMFLLQLCYDGDILIPSPSWVSYAPQARIVGRHIVRVDTRFEDGWFPRPEAVEAILRRDPSRPRLLILNYPGNPTGTTLEADALDAFADLAERYDLLILSDEIYGKTEFDGRHDSIVPRIPHRAIFSGGLSKWCGAGGWRLGVFVFPPALRWLQDAMAAVGTETFTSTSAPIQHAAVRAFREGPEIDAYLLHGRRILRAVVSGAVRTLEATGARVAHPRGAFYVFPDFGAHAERLRRRGVTTSAQLCERLLEETNVAALPGSEFGRPARELTVRMALVDFDGARALEASRAIGPDAPLPDDFAERLAPRVHEALARIRAWFDALE